MHFLGYSKVAVVLCIIMGAGLESWSPPTSYSLCVSKILKEDYQDGYGKENGQDGYKHIQSSSGTRGIFTFF